MSLSFVNEDIRCIAYSQLCMAQWSLVWVGKYDNSTSTWQILRLSGDIESNTGWGDGGDESVGNYEHLDNTIPNE